MLCFRVQGLTIHLEARVWGRLDKVRPHLVGMLHARLSLRGAIRVVCSPAAPGTIMTGIVRRW